MEVIAVAKEVLQLKEAFPVPYEIFFGAWELYVFSQKVEQ